MTQERVALNPCASGCRPASFCDHRHSDIEGALRSRRKVNPDVAAIRSTTVYVYQCALDLLEEVEVNRPYLAEFNLPFCMATAFNFCYVDICDVTEEWVKNKGILRLMNCISLGEDPELTRLYPQK